MFTTLSFFSKVNIFVILCSNQKHSDITACKRSNLVKMGSRIRIRYNDRRSRKRKGFAIKSTKTHANNASACAKKLAPKSSNDRTPLIEQRDFNFMVNSTLLVSQLLSMIGQCPACAASVNIEHLDRENMGLAQSFRASSVECRWYFKFCSSKECKKVETTSGRRGYDINKRTCYCFS